MHVRGRREAGCILLVNIALEGEGGVAWGGEGGGATTILHSQEPAHNAVYGVEKGHPVVGGVGCPLVGHQSLKPCT